MQRADLAISYQEKERRLEDLLRNVRFIQCTVQLMYVTCNWCMRVKYTHFYLLHAPACVHTRIHAHQRIIIGEYVVLSWSTFSLSCRFVYSLATSLHTYTYTYSYRLLSIRCCNVSASFVPCCISWLYCHALLGNQTRRGVAIFVHQGKVHIVFFVSPHEGELTNMCSRGHRCP